MWESLAAAILIMLLRCFDVALGTMRVVYVVEGRRAIAMGIALIESAAFLIALTIALSDLGDPVRMAGYAVGFAAGNGLGMTLVQALGLGNVNLRFFTRSEDKGLEIALREAGFPLTVFNAKGRDGPVGMILMLISKREVGRAMAAARPWLPQCFVTVGDEPYMPAAGSVRK